jgi:two-component system osmolarity sensor histidine kinase EnvZ
MPRSLLWRTVALLVPLLVASQLAWFVLFSLYEREPRGRQIAERVASVVNLTRAGLVGSRPERRRELLLELNETEGIRVFPDDPGLPAGSLHTGRVISVATAELRRLLGEETRIYTARGAEPALWVSFRIDEDLYWVVLPPAREYRPFPWQWFTWGAIVLLLSVAGAFLIVRRISDRLRAAIPAAAAVGRGELPEPLPETGPAEIAALGRAFNRMARDVHRLDADRKLLLAGVSHDLRTPLARLRLGIEMLGDADRTLVEGMIQDVSDLDAIIDQFLAYVREGGSDEPARPADLNALVEATADRYRRQGVPLAVQTTPLPPLSLRPTAMQRVLGNLIDNAHRHGGADITVRTARAGGDALLSVLDRGPGLPPGSTQALLEPFTRVETARTGPGSGLGLAIVARIVRLHGGQVRLLARDGGGLEARIELPIRS